MEKKICNAIRIVAAIGMLLSGAGAMSVAAPIARDAPRVPDTVHTVQLALRGFGMRYVTEQQWTSISLYWYVFYVMIALFVVAALGTWAYQGFMEGWRSDEK
jgi:hypothetical protein